jgi:hypothetical protein
MKSSEIMAGISEKSKQQQEAATELKLLQAAQTRRELAEARQQIEDLTQNLKMIQDISQINIEPIRIKAEKPTASEATAVVIASDWHVFETVRKEEVNGLNEYNVGIARKSIESFFQKIALLTAIERKVVPVDRLVLGLIGDLMTNQLHQDQVETGAGTAMEEVLFLSEVITGGIDFLLDKGGFKEICLPCCDGNHSRNTDKQQHANRVKHSYEWLLYSMLSRHYAGDSRVRFDISEGQLLYTELYGRVHRWTHGDAIKYNGGIGGITIPVIKAIVEWDKGQKADMTFFGHLHTSLLGKSFCSNGSVLGYAPFSVRIKAAYEMPQQSYMVFDSKRGLTAYRPIYVR